MSNYVFPAAFPPDHFVSKYIAYASQLTDASHEYHEAMALSLLASATPDVRAPIAQFPEGLRTNLYLGLIGTTSSSRKTTAKNIGVKIARLTLPNLVLNQKATPEAFAQELAAHSKRGSMWAVDEFAEQLVAMHKREYMAGLAGLLLEVYDGTDYTYNRTKNPVKVEQPHLSIVGCTADTIFEELNQRHVSSGLLPRFGIVMPDEKPDRMPFFEMQPNQVAEQNDLVQHLHALCPQIDAQGQFTGHRKAVFTDEARALHDAMAADHEREYTHELFRRLTPMALKVGILSAVGQPFRLKGGQTRADIEVTGEDMHSALLVIARWRKGAERFHTKLGAGFIERQIEKALALFKKHGTVLLRRDIARWLHLEAKVMKSVEETLKDREMIRFCKAPQSDRDCWEYVGPALDASGSSVTSVTTVT